MDGNGTDASQEDLSDFEEFTEESLRTILDDEARAEMEELVGLKVVGIELWEDSLGDDDGAPSVPSEERIVFDCDLFLDHGMALELYATVAYPDPEADPAQGLDHIFDVVGQLTDAEMELVDYDQADEEGGLALAFGQGDRVQLVLLANAWAVSGWEPHEDEEEELA